MSLRKFNNKREYVRLPGDRWRHAPLHVSLTAFSFQLHSGSKRGLVGLKQMEVNQDIHSHNVSSLGQSKHALIGRLRLS